MRPRSTLGGRAVSAGGVFLAATAGLAQQSPPADGPAKAKTAASAGQRGAAHSPAAIQRAIAELGSASYLAREDASQRLWKAGIEVQPALERLVGESDDFEAVCRGGKSSTRFNWAFIPTLLPRPPH